MMPCSVMSGKFTTVDLLAKASSHGLKKLPAGIVGSVYGLPFFGVLHRMFYRWFSGHGMFEQSGVIFHQTLI